MYCISGLSSLPDIIFDDQDEMDESDKCPETALQLFKTSVIQDAPSNFCEQSGWSDGAQEKNYGDL